jgi:hypothetical protein
MGLVLELADKFTSKGIYLPVKKQYLDTVRTLYCASPKVRVFGVDQDAAQRQIYGFARKHKLKVARVGFGKQVEMRWDRSFYEMAGVDFETSWSRFIPGNAGADASALFENVVHADSYMLIHDEGSVGRFDLRLPKGGERVFVRPHKSPSGLLAWRKVIEKASEIHCIDSSVVHLIDRLPDVTGQRLYLHDARGSGCTFARRRSWELVSYAR